MQKFKYSNNTLTLEYPNDLTLEFNHVSQETYQILLDRCDMKITKVPFLEQHQNDGKQVLTLQEKYGLSPEEFLNDVAKAYCSRCRKYCSQLVPYCPFYPQIIDFLCERCATVMIYYFDDGWIEFKDNKAVPTGKWGCETNEEFHKLFYSEIYE